MNLKLPFKFYTLAIALILGYFVEFSPVFMDKTHTYEQWNRFIYAVVAIIISVIFENWFNRIKFKQRLVLFIQELKEIRSDHDVEPEAIQKVMKSTTFKLASVLDVMRNLHKENRNDSYKEKGKLNCSICTKDHITDFYSRCDYCKVKSKHWKKAVEK